MSKRVSGQGDSRSMPASAAIQAVLLLCACEEADRPGEAPIAASLEQVFAIEAVIQLGENPADSIAEIGDFRERRDGGHLIGDRHLPRVRTYDEEGRLAAAFGRFGDGPFEFRRITAVAEAPSGRIAVISTGEAHLTYLTPSLAPDTMITFPSGAIDLFPLGPDLLVRTFAGYPDGGRFGHPPLMSGLRYPIAVLDGAGETVGTFGMPSASFRPMPVLESGALASLGNYGTTLPEFFASFDIIDRMDVVGRHLILTRARHNPERAMPPFEIVHTSLEVYDRHSGVKLYEDVLLPDGSRILGGGRFLYLLLDEHFPPWRIAKLRLLTEG